jgi:hypothetical protein
MLNATTINQMQDASKPTAPSTNLPGGFFGFPKLCADVPLSPRTLRELIKQGLIPHIRMKGGRRLLFHGPSVERALLRFQKGGIPD